MQSQARNVTSDTVVYGFRSILHSVDGKELTKSSNNNFTDSVKELNCLKWNLSYFHKRSVEGWYKSQTRQSYKQYRVSNFRNLLTMDTKIFVLINLHGSLEQTIHAIFSLLFPSMAISQRATIMNVTSIDRIKTVHNSCFIIQLISSALAQV